MRDINLLEGLGGRKKFDAKKSLRGAIILVVIVAVLLGGAAFGLRYLNGQFRQELDGINAVIQYKDIGDVKKPLRTNGSS